MRTTFLSRHRTVGEPRSARLSSTALLVGLVLALTATPSPTSAHWTADGSGSGVATTGTLSAPTGVTAAVDAVGHVTVGWSTGSGGVVPDGFVITRHSGELVGEACAGALIEGEACGDASVPDGEYTYVVTAVFASWTARSEASAPVTVSTSPLGAARTFSVLAGTAVVNTGATVISGDLGVSPGASITGFGPGIVGGEIHAGDATAASAHDALVVAYEDLSTRSPRQNLVGDLGDRVLGAGTYYSEAAFSLTGALILNAGGDPNAVFVFQTAAAFNTAALSTVTLINGANPQNVYWAVAGAAGTGAGSSLSGSIVAVGAITLGAGTELIGRALSLGAVTLDSTTIRFTAAPAPSIVLVGGDAATTQDTTPTIAGSTDAPSGSPVTISTGGTSWSTTVGGDGTWSTEIGPLDAGVHDLEVKVRDGEGNGSVARQALTVQVDPPTIDVGTAGTYSVLAGTSVVSTGSTWLGGDLGSGPGGSITGFPPGTAEGTLHTGDLAAVQALTDLDAALDDGLSRTPHTEVVGDIGGQTFFVGVHHSTAALSLTGTLTLDAQGDPDATFIFQTDAAFNTAAGSSVVLIGGAQSSNVFWVVTGAAGTGANSSLVGTVLARGAITLGNATNLTGAALSGDAVTLAAAVIDTGAPAALTAGGEPLTPSAPSARLAEVSTTAVNVRGVARARGNETGSGRDDDM